MRIKLALPALVIAFAAGTLGCSSNHLPSSPSALNSPNTTSSTAGRFRALDDPVMPTPMQVLINIVGSFGATAFMPNPTTANMGDEIVFTNTDLVMHHIVLDDGTDLGDVMPGGSTAPVPLTTPTQSFHCTLHPSMVGSINGSLPAGDPYYPTEPPPYDYYGYAFN